MTDRTLTAAENPSGLSPLVEAMRLESLIARQRRVVLRLAQQLEDAESIRRVLEAELERQASGRANSRADSPGSATREAEAETGSEPDAREGSADHGQAKGGPQARLSGGSEAASVSAPADVATFERAGNTRRAARCEHGFVAGLCESRGCPHRAGRAP